MDILYLLIPLSLVLVFVIGAVFWILGSTGRAVGGRKVWY